MARKGGMDRLSALVTKVYPGREPDALATARAFGWWSRAVSDRVLHNARPVRLNRGVMTIHTSTAAWANSLQLESDSLLKAIRSHSPNAPIHRLQFRVGRLPALRDGLDPRPVPPPVVPVEQLPEEVARELAHIGNNELREAVTKAASRGLATTRARQRRATGPQRR